MVFNHLFFLFYFLFIHFLSLTHPLSPAILHISCPLSLCLFTSLLAPLPLGTNRPPANDECPSYPMRKERKRGEGEMAGRERGSQLVRDDSWHLLTLTTVSVSFFLAHFILSFSYYFLPSTGSHITIFMFTLIATEKKNTRRGEKKRTAEK